MFATLHTRVYFSKRNEVTPAGEIHASFGLSQTENDWIILANDLGNVVDSFKIVHKTKMDHSVGRSTDGAVDFKLFTTPTPGSSNAGAQDFYTPKPIFDLTPGFYVGAQTLSISCADPSAQIRYTTNGFEPNAASPLYTSPISINSTKVIRAIAFGANEPSFTETSSYFIDVTHTVPVVSVCGQEVMQLLLGNQITPVGGFELFEEIHDPYDNRFDSICSSILDFDSDCITDETLEKCIHNSNNMYSTEFILSEWEQFLSKYLT